MWVDLSMLAQDLIPENAELDLIESLMDAVQGEIEVPSVDEMLTYAEGNGLNISISLT